MKLITNFIKALVFVFLFLSTVYAENAVRYEDGILTIPRVDIPGQAGFYQDARFKHTPQGTWELLDFWVADKALMPIIRRKNVEVVMTDSFPVQVFLTITGSLPTACIDLGQINQRLVGNRFEVVVYQARDQPQVSSMGSIGCVLGEVPFELIIPLPVYGLNAGTYEYTLVSFEFAINGEGTGTFILSKDNKL